MSLLLALVVGLTAWTVVEYGMHRFLGHGGRGAPFQRFRAQHLRHHLDPDRHTPQLDLWIGGLVSGAATFVLGTLVAGWMHGLAYAGGYLLGYFGYEALHRLVHTDVPLGPLESIRRHHLAHHADPGGCYGITIPLWDRVLRT